ncbi:MAG TPA: hypothetical protein VK698_24550 [Kofleriaceae bacterium]|nr:hypothetical protein [Kofleriaceae bacterium]
MSRHPLAIAALLLIVAAPAPAVADTHGVPFPRGSRLADPARPDGPYLSGRGFRDTVEHIRRHLVGHGLRHEAVPVYRRPGVTVARFLSRDPSSPWSAIHVFTAANRTYLLVVPGPPGPAAPAPQPSTKARTP